MKTTQTKQILFLILLFLAFILVFALLIYSSVAEANAMETYDAGKKKLIHYQNDEMDISQNEVIEADIIAEMSNLVIDGTLYGDIVAINSVVTLQSGAKIFGHVIGFESEITADSSSQVAGDILELNREGFNISGGRTLLGYGFALTVFDRDTTISDLTNLKGDIVALACNLKIEGHIDGDVYNFEGTTSLDSAGSIDGHLVNYLGNVNLADEMLVTGKILHISEEEEFATNEENNKDREIQRKIEDRYLNRNKEENIVRFWGDVTIEPNEVISGDVVTIRGTIEVMGEINGDVVSVLGDVELDSTARVSGDVVSVGGKIYRHEKAYVAGDVVQTNITGVKVDDGDQHVRVGMGGISVGPRHGDEWKRKYKKKNHKEDESEAFMFRYNRVEGLFLGLRKAKDAEDHAIFNLYGHVGYGFADKTICYQLGIQRRLLGKYGPILGAEMHDVTETEDEWIMPTFENSLAAILLREDFQDFYREEGWSVYGNLNISEIATLYGGYHRQTQTSLERKTNWSVFGGDKKFRSNPAIEELKFNSLRTKLEIDTRNSYRQPDKGWYVLASADFAGQDFNSPESNIDFDRYILDIRRYQPITYGENLDFRIRAASSRGRLPQQYRFDAGRFSALRGYEFKEFENFNRMIVGSMEYRLYNNHNPLNDVLGSDFNLILFADAGYLWNAADSLDFTEGFEDIRWDDFYTSLGFAISNEEGNVRVNFAKRMDEKGSPWVLTFRIRRPF